MGHRGVKISEKLRSSVSWLYENFMQKNKFLHIALSGAVVAALAASLGVVCYVRGCVTPAKPAVYVDRRHDPVYNTNLTGMVEMQAKIAGVRNAAYRSAEELIEAARKNLGDGADEAAVRAELDAHPERYPEWKRVQAECRAADNALVKHQDAAKRLVRERLWKERNDRKAVADGKATALDASAVSTNKLQKKTFAKPLEKKAVKQ